ncbi:MAG: NYN domain-containing protein [Chloroflexi bacterium]|nr:NYN domain-containing protein [Chloroflexota bacterium]
MPYIIDGHNLIPKIPGMSLQDLDDEIQLVNLLQEFCRIRRKQVEVYFDNAPPGSPGARNYGRVVARFIRQGRTADQAIQMKLKRLGGEARNWTVVSSDGEVQTNARAVRAKILTAEVFAQQLFDALGDTADSYLEPESDLSPEEVEDWMQIFGMDEDEEN